MIEPAPRSPAREGAPPDAPARAAFAHASEAEMARILTFYDVRWQYEPTTFPILWNLEGDVVESFAPDFYLPDLDLYLEMTTLQQRLVRKKNRKLRRLRELYPDIRIKLFYARDFRAMMLKYGRLGLAASLSGTIGQLSIARTGIRVEPAADPSGQAVDSVDATKASVIDEPIADSILEPELERALAPVLESLAKGVPAPRRRDRRSTAATAVPVGDAGALPIADEPTR